MSQIVSFSSICHESAYWDKVDLGDEKKGSVKKLLLKAFGYLDLRSLASVRLTCKKWNCLIEDETLWQPILKKVSNASLGGLFTTGSKREFIFKNILIEKRYINFTVFAPFGSDRMFLGEEWLYRLGISSLKRVTKEYANLPYHYSDSTRIACTRLIDELIAHKEIDLLLSLANISDLRETKYALEKSIQKICKVIRHDLFKKQANIIIKILRNRDVFCYKVIFMLGWKALQLNDMDLIKEIILTAKVGRYELIRAMHKGLLQRNVTSDIDTLYPEAFKTNNPERSDIEFYTSIGEFDLAIKLANEHTNEVQKDELLRIITVQQRSYQSFPDY